MYLSCMRFDLMWCWRWSTKIRVSSPHLFAECKDQKSTVTPCHCLSSPSTISESQKRHDLRHKCIYLYSYWPACPSSFVNHKWALIDRLLKSDVLHLHSLSKYVHLHITVPAPWLIATLIVSRRSSFYSTSRWIIPSTLSLSSLAGWLHPNPPL